MATATVAVEGVLSHAADVGAGDAAAVLLVLPTAPPALYQVAAAAHVCNAHQKGCTLW